MTGKGYRRVSRDGERLKHKQSPRFSSANEGMNLSKRAWVCGDCGASHAKKFVACDTCGASLHYLASKIEQERFAELRLARMADEIDHLETGVRYPIKINGQLVTTYVADFVYVDLRTRRTVIEDTKPRNFQTDLSKLKIALFQAVFAPQGWTITIIRK